MNNSEFTRKIYRTLTYSIYIIYVLLFLGIWNSAPEYLDDLNYYLKIFVSLVLLYTFNPLYNIKFDKIHKDIAFSAGILLIASTSLKAFQNRISNTYKRVKDDLLQ